MFRPNFTCYPVSWFGDFDSGIKRCLAVYRCALNVRLWWSAGPSGATSDLCCGCRCLFPQSFNFSSDLGSEVRLLRIFFFSVGVGVIFSRAGVGGVGFFAGLIVSDYPLVLLLYGPCRDVAAGARSFLGVIVIAV